MDFTEYFNACAYLLSLGKLDSRVPHTREPSSPMLGNTLLRTQDLLNRLGNPEKGMKYIHVTGTSGKGTVVSLLHHSLEKAGYTVGSTLSPATTTTIERIKVGGEYIDSHTFVELVNELKPVIHEMYLNGEYGKPSYLECILAIELLYFQREGCQWVVLEAAMGGRHDSTNVIPPPEVSVITNVGMDHMHLLGNSREAIAYEKAGIIKKGSTFFTTETDPKILDIFSTECDKQGAHFTVVSSESHSNYHLVAAVCQHLGIDAAEVESVKLPCRFEHVSSTPEIILDGAHNVNKVEYTVEKIRTSHHDRLHVVFGTGETKDAVGMIDVIAQVADSITLCPVVTSMGKSFSMKRLYNHLKSYYPHISTHLFIDPRDALAHARALAHQDDTILVTGSLYLTGELRKQWYPESYILQNRKSF